MQRNVKTFVGTGITVVDGEQALAECVSRNGGSSLSTDRHPQNNA